MAPKCPTCKKAADVDGKYFPFCSERCRLIDLGRWLDGKYQIPVEEPDETDETPERSDVRRRPDDAG